MVKDKLAVIPQKEYRPNNPDGDSLSCDEYLLSSGYIHGDCFTGYSCIEAAGATAHVGTLEPHSLSLADWAEQWVYIAFHHDSSDDNYVKVDDLLLLGNLLSSTGDVASDPRFVTYPNPVQNYLNVMFRTEKAADLSLELYGANGQRVAEIPMQDGHVGEFNERFDLRLLPAGNYQVVLTIDGQRITKNVARQ